MSPRINLSRLIYPFQRWLIYTVFQVKMITRFIKPSLSASFGPQEASIVWGANIGLFSLLASELVGHEGRVIAFEPGPQTFTCLMESVKYNNRNNIEAHNCGLSDEDGELLLQVSPAGFDAFDSFVAKNQTNASASVPVPVTTLNRALSSIDKSRIKLVKIDVEGWEKLVLKGGDAFFEAYHPFVMMEFADQNTFNAGYMVQELYDTMVNWGYQWFESENGALVPSPKKLRYPYNNLIAIKPQA